MLNRLKNKRLIGHSYHKNYYYYGLLTEHYNDFSEYLRVIDMYQKKESVGTNKTIALQEDFLFNFDNKSQISRKFKNSDFKTRIQKNKLDIKIYFYKIIIGGYKVRLEIHQCHRKMFYCNYTFTSFLNHKQHQEITKIIQEKYLDGLPIDTDTQSIIDTDQTQLVVENGLELKIHYISTNSAPIKALSVHQETHTNKKVRVMARMQHELRTNL